LGVTVNHITGLKVVLPNGRIVELGGKAQTPAGLSDGSLSAPKARWL